MVRLEDFDGSNRDRFDKLATLRDQTVVLPEGELYVDGPVYFGRGCSVVSAGRRIDSTKIRIDSPDDAPAATIAGGYGCEFRNFEIEIIGGRRRTGLLVAGGSSMTADNISLRVHKSHDSTGVEIAGKESIHFDRMAIRAGRPVYMRWGDNITFDRCDWTASGPTSDIRPAIVEYAPTAMPDHHYFFRSTWQLARQAIYARCARPKFGSGLFIYGIRYEQSTGRATDWAWHFEFLDRHLETLEMRSTRHTDGHKFSVYARGVLKPAIDRQSCFIPGQYSVE